MSKDNVNLDDIKEKLEKGKIKLRCSFCGKAHSDVRKMVAGPRVYICDECIVLSLGIMLENKPITLAFSGDDGTLRKETTIDFDTPDGASMARIMRCGECGRYIFIPAGADPKCPVCGPRPTIG